MSVTAAERVAILKQKAAGAPVLIANQLRVQWMPSPRPLAPCDLYIGRYAGIKISTFCLASFFEQLAASLGVATSMPPAREMTWKKKHEIQKAIIGEEKTRGYDVEVQNTISCSGVDREIALLAMGIVKEIIETLELKAEVQKNGDNFLLALVAFAFREIEKVPNLERITLQIEAQYEAIANHIIEQTLQS